MVTRKLSIADLQADGYWDIAPDKLYDVTTEPSEFDVGSLSDDWEFARKLLDPKRQPLANQLSQVASLLRRIGEVLGEALAKEGG